MIIGQHVFPSAENERTAIMFSFDVLFSTEYIFLVSVGCKTSTCRWAYLEMYFIPFIQ